MTFQELYDELEKLVHYIAHQKANGAFLMDHDEISGELFEVLVMGYAKYGHLPKEELVAVVKQMMDNRIADLIRTHYRSHRKLGNSQITIPDDGAESVNSIYDWSTNVVWSSCENGPEIDDLLESEERVQETINRLSEGAKQVLLAILRGHPALENQLYFAGLRATTVYVEGGKVRVRPWQLADSLGVSVYMVKKHITEIRSVYKEVCDGV